MCNLYRLDQSTAEVGRLCEAVSSVGANTPAEVYPGYPGLVIAGGELRSMVWGFPLALKGKQGQQLTLKPVNNTRADKLDSSFWRTSFASRRCLIPLSAFAEAEGPKGKKTRTWLSLPDQPVFAIAGIWRPTEEWGPAYSMVMTEACLAMDGIHDHMPVVLPSDSVSQWLEGSPADARELCTPYSGPMAIKRTDQPWTQKAELSSAGSN
ncbi:SOS response-associated peptidase [Altericroceibacterium xinjiangense]|uniref:SOS response-associated peptidase n=1 Tax=Altericroceibacterium xinjiangense TaxID=762261 RepID=UPI000F7EAA08|nr:SOS response-associated peptidase family protein [Altericroceibacterium xinjiangense]